MVTAQRALPQPKGVIWAPIDLAIDLADGMKEKGHHVTFYAPPSPKLKHKVVSRRLQYGINDAEFLDNIKKERKIMPYGLNHVSLFDQYLITELYKDAEKGKFDVIHMHVERALPFVQFFKTPTLITFHDPINPFGARALRLFKGPRMHLVSISDAQRKPAPDLSYAGTVYNGIDMDMFKFGATPTDRFLFCSRLLRQKGVEDAIGATKQCRGKLDIVGRHYSKLYLKSIKAMCTSNIVYRGSKNRSDLPKLYRQAKALLFPIKWEEPFGLVMVEAMACGTPVIAYNRGSVPEVIKDGVTGFIVKNKRGMVRAMRKIDTIDRRACREWVEKRFSTQRMVDDYEKLYFKAFKWK